MQEIQVPSLVWEDPLEKEWQPTPVFLPGESHGQRSWQAIVHGVVKNQKRLKGLSTHACKEGTLGTMINISGRLRLKITFDQRRIFEISDSAPKIWCLY